MRTMYDVPPTTIAGLSVSAAVHALALALLASPTQAQFDGGNDHSFDLYPETGEMGVPSSSAQGHLFGDLGIDVIVLFDETPMVFKAPEVYRSRSDLPVVATDLAVYPRFPAGPDWIFVVGPDGLTRWIWDGAAFVDSSPVDQSGSPWLGAVDIGTADIDGDADMDLYGVNAARDRVLLSRFVAQVWDNTISTPIPQPILAVEPVEWINNAFQNLAVRTAGWLYIVDYLGNVIDFQPMDQRGELMRVIDVPQATNQALCLFFDGPLGPHQRLDVVSSGLLHQSIDLGSLGTVGLQLGDLDSDLDTDLVLSHTDGATLQLWKADLVGGLLNFLHPDDDDDIVVTGWTSSQLNEATPAVADFDNDSDLDVVFAPVGADRIDMNANGTFDETTLMCSLKEVSMDVNSSGNGRFFVTLNVPAAAQPNPVPSIWTDVMVDTWRQPRFDYLMEQDAFDATDCLPIVSGEVIVEIQTTYDQWFEDIFHIEVHLVERQAGVTINQGPGYTAMIGLAQPILALWEIEGLSNGGGMPEFFFVVPPQFLFPFTGGTPTHIRGQQTPGDGGMRLPGMGKPPIPPAPPPSPAGTPNPLFDGHEIRYETGDSEISGGGSGGLPDIPAWPTNYPPIPPPPP